MYVCIYIYIYIYKITDVFCFCLSSYVAVQEKVRYKTG